MQTERKKLNLKESEHTNFLFNLFQNNINLIVKKFDITSNRNRLEYVIRYVKRPRPIILADFSDSFGEDISIHGENTVSECELDPSIHEEILQRAVELAKIAWAGEPATTVQAGQRSE